MKSFIFTGLIAATAALPTYGGNQPLPSYDQSSAVSTVETASNSQVATTSSLSGVTYGGPSAPTGTGKTVCTKKNKSHKSSAKAASPTGIYAGNSTGSGSTSVGTGSSSMPTFTPPKGSNSTGTGAGNSTSSGNSTSNGNSTADNSGFLRGINVGNWLILEQWMDDGSVFTGKFSGAHDQWSFDSIDGAEDALQKHWSSWFTEDDVAKIAGYGFNALRIPIGFWAFDNSGTPYKQGAAYWMDQAIGWAAKHNMKVLVDMHGSPGSQNGQDHSGHSGAIQWQQGDNLDKSTKILVQMAKKYGAANYTNVVWGLEMVNEPTANAPNNFGKSQSWAQDAYQQMYDVLENKDLRIVTHDSFMGPQKFVSIAQDLTKKLPAAVKTAGGKSTGTTFGVDQHDYQMYTDSDNSLDQKTHIQHACGWADNLKQAKGSMPTIVGEWSILTNICANDDGSTHPSNQGGGGSCTSDDPSKWSKALIDQVRHYVEAQLEVFEQNSDGYFLWSYKGPGGWGVDGPAKVGAFPKNVVSDRKYQGQCGGK